MFFAVIYLRAIKDQLDEQNRDYHSPNSGYISSFVSKMKQILKVILIENEFFDHYFYIFV